MKIKTRKTLHVAGAFVLCVVGKNPKTPNLSPMADDAITWGGIGGLGSLVYIYESTLMSSILLKQTKQIKHYEFMDIAEVFKV